MKNILCISSNVNVEIILFHKLTAFKEHRDSEKERE